MTKIRAMGYRLKKTPNRMLKISECAVRHLPDSMSRKKFERSDIYHQFVSGQEKRKKEKRKKDRCNTAEHFSTSV